MIHDLDDELLFRVATGAAPDDEVRAVEVWRGRSPDNERRFVQVAGILGAMTELEGDRRVPEPPPVGLITGKLRPVVMRASLGRRFGILGLAAAAVLAVGGVVWRTRAPSGPPVFGAEQFVTGPAETATIQLKDSTVVRLAPKSRLRLLQVAGVRAVVLEGRGYFAVAKNAELPFRIQTDAGTLTVLGTRFDVEVSNQDLRLVVVEGRVALVPTNSQRVVIGAGEMSQVKAGRLLPVIKVPDVTAVTRWTGSFLAFQGTPFREAIREIERQYGVRVTVTDPTLSDRTLTMWFADERLDSVLGVVCLVLESKCTVNGANVTIQPY